MSQQLTRVHKSDRSKSLCDLVVSENHLVPSTHHVPETNIAQNNIQRRCKRRAPIQRQKHSKPSQPEANLAQKKYDISLYDTDIEMDVTLRVSPPSELSDSPPNEKMAPGTSDSTGTDNGLLSRKRLHRKGRKSRQRTVQGVTDEARIVLEQFLERSLSTNDTSPLKRGFLANGGFLPAPPVPYSGTSQDMPPHGETMYSDRSSGGSHVMRSINERNIPYADDDSLEDMVDGNSHPIGGRTFGTRTSGTQDDDDDDYTSHSPVSNTTSVYSGVSQSSSFHKKKNYIRPVPPEEVDAALRRHDEGKTSTKRKSLRRRRPTKENSTTSSTASENSDVSDSNESGRKKKTLFKRAAERVRQSFRMLSEREKTFDQQQLAASARKKGRPSSFQSNTFSYDISPMGVASDNGSAVTSLNSSGGKVSRSSSKTSRKMHLIHRNEKENKSIIDNLLKSIKKKNKKKSVKSDSNGYDRSQSTVSPELVAFDDPDCLPLRPTDRQTGYDNLDYPAAPRDGMTLDLVVNRPNQIGGGYIPKHPGSRPTSPGHKQTPPSGVIGGREAAVTNWLTDVNHHESSRRKSSTAGFDMLDEPDAGFERDSVYEHYADHLVYMTGFEGQPQGQVQAQCSAQGHTPVELKSLSPPNLPIRTPSLERRIAEILRHKGDQVNEDETDLMPIVRDQSYEHFAEVIGNKVAESVGSEPSWQQVAFLFKVSQSTISLASKGSKAAANVKEWTLRYFEDKVANWVVGQGGWESMVEDTSVDDELD